MIDRRRSAHTPLSPTLIDRLGSLSRPGWARTAAIRRGAAAVLIVAGLATAAFGYIGDDGRSVIVAARALTPGHAIVAADLTTEPAPAGLIVGGVRTQIADVVGSTVAGSIAAGEIIADSRLLTPRLPRQLIGDDGARLVPIRLDNPAITTLLRHGDIVDVLAESGRDSGDSGHAASDSAYSGVAQTIAKDAVVAVVPPTTGHPTGTATPVLVALHEKEANAVAAAGLNSAITVVLH